VVKKRYEIEEMAVKRFPDLLKNVEDADAMIRGLSWPEGFAHEPWNGHFANLEKHPGGAGVQLGVLST